MAEANSPYFWAGLADGAEDAMRPARFRRGFDPMFAGSWMYRRGFARSFLAVRRAVRPAGAPGGPGVVMLRPRPETVPSGRLSGDTILRWGHARREACRQIDRQPPAWIAGLEREYQRRRYVRSKRATRAAS